MYDVQNQEVDLMFNLVSSLALIHTNKYLIWSNSQSKLPLKLLVCYVHVL